MGKKRTSRLPEAVLSLLRRILKAVGQISEMTFSLSEICDVFEMILQMIPKNNKLKFSWEKEHSKYRIGLSWHRMS